MRYIAGIDPGVKTGVALWDDLLQRWNTVETWDFHQVMTWAELVSPETKAALIIVVESARNLPVYHNKHGKAGRGIGLARSIGENNRESELLIGELKRRGFNVVTFEPRSTFEDQQPKWDAATLAEVTGYAERTNEHERDAMRFAWTHKHLLRVKGGVR